MNILKIPFSGTPTFEMRGTPDVLIVDDPNEFMSVEFREAVRASGKYLVARFYSVRPSIRKDG